MEYINTIKMSTDILLNSMHYYMSVFEKQCYSTIDAIVKYINIDTNKKLTFQSHKQNYYIDNRSLIAYSEFIEE